MQNIPNSFTRARMYLSYMFYLFMLYAINAVAKRKGNWEFYTNETTSYTAQHSRDVDVQSQQA